MADLHAQAEVALTAALNRKLTPRQRALAHSCPQLLLRLAHTSALPPRPGEVAEDVGADASPRVSRRLEQLAGLERRNAVVQFFWTYEPALYPLCAAVAVALQGTPTDLRRVAEGVQRQLSELPSDKTGLLWRFGPQRYCSKLGDSTEEIFSRLTAQQGKKRRVRRLCEPASPSEVEALARRWDEYQERPPQQARLVFDVAISWDYSGGGLTKCGKESRPRKR